MRPQPGVESTCLLILIKGLGGDFFHLASLLGTLSSSQPLAGSALSRVLTWAWAWLWFSVLDAGSSVTVPDGRIQGWRAVLPHHPGAHLEIYFSCIYNQFLKNCFYLSLPVFKMAYQTNDFNRGLELFWFLFFDCICPSSHIFPSLISLFSFSPLFLFPFLLSLFLSLLPLFSDWVSSFSRGARKHILIFFKKWLSLTSLYLQFEFKLE